ncbi:MAG: hypothetical protein A2508_06965 [Candidatus Lambdaproteobacteria bacterium RIFOXYD12_FULL_49_8]|uniref:RNA-binding S4 domain-containing protein n=1 Tax=Candidatus Lambdaproteobacteria bacterium RIFOXYD2_FULL_50_16 TaxID=1817772 RepID=A0A1F6GBI5_9PROT|nr:MAG: hypothetical protein A2527_07115 [Candidatus Lambdaproteobacteria bacterium RIFOXYD2_FULL_50_16]OGG98091.1 MAG: hypothetical protein A2508_06965 [Candidatus Lambdaproteobacteria bacterium RIFOXYD12_FULL_49_8]
MKKERIDQLLLNQGLVPTLERARALLMAGRVLVGNQPVTKPGALVTGDAQVRLKGEELPFVGRGGLKLEAALETWEIDLKGQLCLDVGASTGGFSDCMLQAGAALVWAVDSGQNQLDQRLRRDRRVICLEKTNFRYAQLELTGSYVDFAAVDVSFISLKLILGPLYGLLVKGGHAVVLVKPQFEAGRGQIGKGGLVEDPLVRQEVVRQIVEFAQALGFLVRAMRESPIEGKKSGNLETLLWLEK